MAFRGGISRMTPARMRGNAPGESGSRRRYLIRRSIAKRVIGSLIYFATEIVEPGVIRHDEGNRISLGEPDGSRSERIRAIAEALVASGLRARSPRAFATKSGSRCWATWPSIPSARSPAPPLQEFFAIEHTRNLVRNIMQETESVASETGHGAAGQHRAAHGRRGKSRGA